MTWWLWLFLGLILLGAEIMTPGGFYMLFFGLAALLVGALAGFDLVVAEWIQWLLFSAFSIVSLAVFRNPLRRWMNQDGVGATAVDTMVGELALVLEDLAPGALGKAEFRGTTWNVRNTGATTLTKGQRSRVDHVDGLTLSIKAE
ncbi:MAG TPA: NfeD family protein [Nitrospiraceae bacterium]|jgi:membrane protein implicated in regulation of membrane protease activity|nr:NfeD family protein [Nitrospiraceae bacterium]